MTNDFSPAAQTRMAQRFYVAAMAIYFFHFLSNTLFAPLLQPVLVYPSTDFTFWVFLGAGIPQFFTHSVFRPAIADIFIFITLLAAIFLEDSRPFWAVLFTIITIVFIITFGSYSGHHYHGLIMVFIGSIPFWFKNPKKFALLFEAARYYFLFIFASACCWKLFRGGLFEPAQMINILRAQHAQYLFENPAGWFAPFLRYLLTHPAIAQILLITAAVLQGIFSIGFFTKKYDTFLFYAAILFCALNFAVMRIPAFELLIGILFLTKPQSQESTAENSR